MSLADFVRKQFIDVIDWVESEPGLLAYRFPMQDREIQTGAMLTVRESQLAVFINEGRLADVFKPGLYKLSTHTLPVLTYLRNWDKAFQSPFKSDVYFFTQREQLDQQWGTAQPITIRDKDFGAMRIRGYGNYAYRIHDVAPFWQRLSGTFERYRVSDLEGQLRARVLTEIASFLGASELAFVDMAANQSKLSATLKQALTPSFAEYGLELTNFLVESLSLPEEVQRRMDAAASMRVVGDLRAYTQFQTAEAIPVAAANSSGTAGVGVGIGAGAALGQAMAAQVGTAAGMTAAGAAAPPAAATGVSAPAAAATTGAAATAGAAGDPFALLERLHELANKGVITRDEFEAKKAQILSQIR